MVLLTAVLLVPAASAHGETVGSATAILANADSYCKESVLGDVVSDALRLETGADLAIVFSGDLDLYLMAGNLTREDVQAAVPKNTDYTLVSMTPAELTAVLEQGVGNLVLNESESIDYDLSQCDNFPQISGFSIRCDASAPVGERILDLVLTDGTPLDTADDQTRLLVALPAAALSTEQAERGQVCGGIQDIFLSYLAKNSPLEAPKLERILIIGAHAQPLISSAPVIMIGLIILVCAVMAIPSILRWEKNPEARETVYFTGIFHLRNKK